MICTKFILKTKGESIESETEAHRIRINSKCNFEDVIQRLTDWGKGIRSITYLDNDGDVISLASQDEWVECTDLWRLMAAVENPLRPLVLRVSVDELVKKRLSVELVTSAIQELPAAPIPDILDAVFEKPDVLESLKEGIETPESLGASEWLSTRKSDTHLDIDINTKFLYDLMIAKGVSCLGHNDMAASTSWFDKCTTVLPHNPLGWYNLACCSSVSGLQTSAISYLEKAFECGYSKPAHLESDPDLELIRKHPKFVSLRKRVTPSVQVLKTRRSDQSRHVNFLISEESDSDDVDDESTPFLGGYNSSMPLCSVQTEDPFMSMHVQHV